MRLGWMHARKRMPCNTPFPSPGMRRSAARKVLAVSFSFAPATNARLRSRSTNTSQNGRNNALPKRRFKKAALPLPKISGIELRVGRRTFRLRSPCKLRCPPPPSKTKTPPGKEGFRHKKKVRPYDLTLKRRLPTLPRENRSTIGVSELNFSVRNGKRWNLTAITT